MQHHRTSRAEKPFASEASCGFTIIELLVVIAVLGVLAALVLSLMSKSMNRAKDARCLANLNQIGAASLMYAADNNDLIVPGFNGTGTPIWQDRLAPYMGNTRVRDNPSLQCQRAAKPQTGVVIPTCYAINHYLSGVSSGLSVLTRFVQLPSHRKLLLFADQPKKNQESIGPFSFVPAQKAEYFRHYQKIHVLWTDMSVSPASESELMADCYDNSKSLWKFR